MNTIVSCQLKFENFNEDYSKLTRVLEAEIFGYIEKVKFNIGKYVAAENIFQINVEICVADNFEKIINVLRRLNAHTQKVSEKYGYKYIELVCTPATRRKEGECNE